MNGSTRRSLLISKGWMQAIVIVVLCGFLIETLRTGYWRSRSVKVIEMFCFEFGLTMTVRSLVP